MRTRSSARLVASEVCGAWRTMTYGIPAGDISEWRNDPIDDAVKEDEDL